MIDYNLRSDEFLVIECENVTLDDNKFINEQGNLALTNQNLIWVAKSVFGKIKNVQKYPLSDIKIYDEKAQVQIKEKIGEPTKLMVLFTNGQIAFTTYEKAKMRELANSINKLVTGTETDLVAKRAIPGTAFIAETLKGSVGTFKHALGIQSKGSQKTTQNCMACGASVSGIKGQVVKCSFCGTEIKLT